MYISELLYRKRCINSVLQRFHGMMLWISKSVQIETRFYLFIYYVHPIAYFIYPCIARQWGYFQCLWQVVLRCHRTYIFIHMCKCFCRVDSQKGERRILACDLQAFSILFHASQLPLLISAEPPFESNLANSHSRGGEINLFKVILSASASTECKENSVVTLLGCKIWNPSPTRAWSGKRE